METFELLIIWIEPNTKTKTVEGVNAYGTLTEAKLFFFEKNGFKSYVPMSTVRFFGREFDFNPLVTEL